MFRDNIGQNIFDNKYARYRGQTWRQKCVDLIADVTGLGVHNQFSHNIMSTEHQNKLLEYMDMGYVLPGGRYIYYAGRLARFWNNCYLLLCEADTREEWANICWRAMSCLMVGGGIGIDYSILRPKGKELVRTGGMSSGPVPLMMAINEVGRQVRQGGGRRSAMYASLNWQHEDIFDFLMAKDWDNQKIGSSGMTVGEMKRHDFDFPAPLDMTNVSVNYDDAWLNKHGRENDIVFWRNVELACMNGEPGFSFNFGDKQNETARNACTEVTSPDDSDVCNLASPNLSRIPDQKTFEEVVDLTAEFLVCGTMRAELPYEKVYKVREKNRRLGMGLMGIHEWLMKRDKQYGPDKELGKWMETYVEHSESAADAHCNRFFLSRPAAYRAIAPTGTIGMLAGTTTGIEPLYALAYQRRYLVGDKWKKEYKVDAVAKVLMEQGIKPEQIETSIDLAKAPERRLEFQAWMQTYVDQGISSTINLPAWGTEHNNKDTLKEFARVISKYAPQLRGLTLYPDGARGGQPITSVPIETALKHGDAVYEDNSEAACREGVCGI